MTFCYRYRDHAPRLNRIVGVRLGPSRAAGPAPRAPPGPPSAPCPDPALDQNLGTLIFNEIPCDTVITLYKTNKCSLLAEICSYILQYIFTPLLICFFRFRYRSRRHSNRRSRSRSYSNRRKSRSRSYSQEYRRKKSPSASPNSSRRRPSGSKVHVTRSEVGRVH